MEMRTDFFGNAAAEDMLKKADALMAAGAWEEAEFTLRACCSDKADLTLRLAQLEWRRQCAEYASMLDWDALGEDGVKQSLTDNFDIFVAQWVLNEYKG